MGYSARPPEQEASMRTSKNIDVGGMPSVSGKKSTQAQIAKIKQLFGPPPVLSTESEKEYDEILAAFVDDYRPQDMLELSLIRHLTNFTWEAMRYTRYKTLGMSCAFARASWPSAKNYGPRECRCLRKSRQKARRRRRTKRSD
jgi:hypothetical protein